MRPRGARLVPARGRGMPGGTRARALPRPSSARNARRITRQPPTHAADLPGPKAQAPRASQPPPPYSPALTCCACRPCGRARAPARGATHFDDGSAAGVEVVLSSAPGPWPPRAQRRAAAAVGAARAVPPPHTGRTAPHTLGSARAGDFAQFQISSEGLIQHNPRRAGTGPLRRTPNDTTAAASGNARVQRRRPRCHSTSGCRAGAEREVGRELVVYVRVGGGEG